MRNRQLEEFAYIASHDLQEPLRKIRIFSEMLENNLSNPEAAAKYSKKINDGAGRMAALITGILKYSQLSALEQEREAIDLNQIVAEVRDDYELLLTEKNILFTTGKLPVITGIRTQIIQLFANLVSNAIKFSGVFPEISIQTEPISQKELTDDETLSSELEYVKIIVSDNGEGFDQQYAEQVFKIFKRLTTNPGTGIGLALCKKIVENHQGSISVKSASGRGTAFSIFLPTA